ncbi:MAG: nicotinate (nicotinamide) nucleotide adenylyltransferase [Candidatus Obscuribacter sp.]|nr:nicotinate (nicotinamide) nucleotide adenylyltransferase [Candidatus Obscuribacter sp.]
MTIVKAKAAPKRTSTRSSKTRLKIGLYDGTFSPIHYGHLICAERTRQVKGLDLVLFLTCGNPPNKSGVLDAETRHEMVVATVSDNPHFEASRISINQRGIGYTLNAVEKVQEKYGDAELFYLTSSEYLDPDHKWWMGKWSGGKELFKLVTILVFPRDKHEMDKLEEWAKLIPEARIECIEVASPELSSTMIRESVAKGRSIWYRLPWVTQMMVAKHALYKDAGAPAPVKQASTRKGKHVGIYGGQFDPIHYGHLLLAEWAREEYDMDVVEFVTTASPPNNKKAAESAEERHEMVVAATAENPFFRASRVDLDRGTTSYALLTANDMRLKYGDDAELTMLIAADYLDPQFQWRLTEWMGFAELCGKVRFLCFPTQETTHAQALEWLKVVKAAAPDCNVDVIDSPRPNVSSKMLRDWTSRGESILYTTPWVVQQIIRKRKLYQLKPVKARARRK